MPSIGLQRVKKSTTYVDKSDSDIIKDIASDNSLQAKCDSLGEARPFVVQKGITDYDFVMQLARNHGCRVWVDKKELNVKKTPPDSGDLVVEWQKTLIEFDVSLDTNGMHTKVEVRSWDPQSASEIVGTADPGSVTKKIGGSKLGSKLVKDAFGEAKLVVIEPDLKDKKAADDMAADLMAKSSMQFIRGVGRCEGNNKFKAGATVNIKEVGKKFEGDYLILEVDHQFSAVSGFTTGFTVQRNAMG
jgi:phage protein D